MKIKPFNSLFAIALAVVAVLGMASCNEKKFHVNGTIGNAADSTLYFENMSLNGPVVVDSVKLSADGTFDFDDKEYARSVVQKSLAKQFAPEFLNRLDEIITFDQLDLSAITSIVDLELKSLVKRVENLGYHFQMTDKAKEFVASKGYDVQFGARPLKRAIQNYVEDGLCELLMEESLQSGDTICIGKSVKKDELTFKRNKK